MGRVLVLVAALALILVLGCGGLERDCRDASDLVLAWQRQGYDEEQINYLLRDSGWDVYEFYEFLRMCDSLGF